MEKVSEILNNVKERLSNPFLFSLLISWLIYNWEIPVALIWYDKSQFSGCGCYTIFDFITWKLQDDRSYRFPIIFALFYTFVFPIIKGGIKLFNTSVSKFFDDKEENILKDGKIGFNKYLELKKDYKEKIIELVEIIEEQSEERKIAKELLNQNKILENEKLRLQGNLSKIADSSILNGFWKVKTDSYFTKNSTEHEIYIEDGIIFLMEGNERNKHSQIFSFFYNESNSNLIFIKVKYSFSPHDSYNVKYGINTLHVNIQSDGRISLNGNENNDRIDYEKYKYTTTP